MSSSIHKVTVYKIKEMGDFDSLWFSGYSEVSKGTEVIGGISYTYKLFFLNHFKKPPQWYSVFSGLNISKEHVPISQTAGFIMIVKLADFYYAFTGGIGHIRLREALPIEPRFGVELAEKIMSLPELKGLTQKDTSGVVNFMDRAFRTTYNPEGDVSNLKRILTNLRAKLSEHNLHYEDIGKSILAGNALTVTGEKTFDEMLKFLSKVDDLWRNGERIINIPQLRCIEKKFESELIEQLEEKLIEDICTLPNADNTLFLDNEEMGYLPDRISNYELKLGREKVECSTYTEVFEAAGSILGNLNELTDKRRSFHRLKLKVTFDDGIAETRTLSYFICGDVIVDNEYFFVNNRLWYKANDEYIAKLNSEVDNIRYIRPEELQLNEWDDARYAGHNGEFHYNRDNHSYLCLDHKLVHIPNERGGIEFCDLLNDTNGSAHLIHVKKACGAELRALFAQGFVSSQLYAEDSQFRRKIHNADLRREGSELTNEDKRLLANLKLRRKNQIRIIYAIYDNEYSHRVTSNPKNTSQWLNGTLTTFAKVDLLNRVSSIRAMGYDDVAVTRIRPYPAGI